MSKHLIRNWLAACMIFTCGSALAAFDPVNDDTDIFLANPSIAAERPNVLIILDNTANWNNAFANEKDALVSVVNGLNESYNVGLMMFPETGNPNDSVDGGYVRFGIRQMTPENKTALATIVGNLDITADKGNNATTGLALYESYRYFGGQTSIASYGKAKTDFVGNTTYNPLAAALSAGHALPAGPDEDSLYNSPIAAACQKNFIIYISNGPANENASARSWLESRLSTLTGSTPPNTISINPNGQEGNWSDEMAQYMANSDLHATQDGSQNAVTYVVEVDPGAQSADLAMTALMRSVANVGKGKYFAVSSGGAGTAIVDALNKIFTEVQAVNSVFASTTLPVSVNVRGTNINQVYIGVFRPDAQKSPRWLGNLKLYNLALTSGVIYLADALGYPAEDTTTGFITPTSTSFWTSGTLTPTNFWSYRSADINGAGGPSDAPDGDLVEKGGVAQQIRHYFQGEQDTRRLFTCTQPDCAPCTRAGSGSSQTCTGGSELEDTPFTTGNADITVAALNLSTQSVAALSGKRSVNIAGLTDRKAATLARELTSGDSAAATLISSGSGASTRSVTTLTTAAPVAITNITSGSLGTFSTTTTALRWTFNLTKQVGNNTVWDISTGGVTNIPSGQTITSGPTISSAVSGNVTVASMSGSCGSLTTPTINITTAVAAGTGINNASPPGSPKVTGPKENIGSPVCTVTVDIASTYGYTASTTSTTAAVTTATPHGYLSGQTVTTSGLSNSLFNCTTAGITVISANSFSCTLNAPQYSTGTPAITGNVSGNSQIITVTTSAANGYAAGGSVIISGASPAGYNDTYTVLTNTSSLTVGKDGATNFTGVTGWPTHDSAASTFRLLKASNSYPSLLTPNTASPVYVVGSAGSTTVNSLTLTFAANPFIVGDDISISGAAVSGYNVVSPSTCDVTSVTATTATCDLPVSVTGPLPDDASGTATVASNAVYGTTVTATVAAHGFVSGDQVMVESVGGSDANFAATPGTYAITKLSDDTFSFSTAFSLPDVAPAGSFNVRLGGASGPKAYATAAAHGFVTGDTVTIAGATPAAYNGSHSVTVVDADHFTYSLAAVLPEDVTKHGTATVMGTASINTTTATAQANNHGFTDGASIAISGASPNEFNGTFTITVPAGDSHHFTYTLPSAQGDATGAIVAVASSAGAGLRDDIINWVRGQDNAEDENGNASFTDIRASNHGDVLHSRPAVINYNRHDSDNDVYIFYGANDGIFHAVQGGMLTDEDDPDGLTAGQETWGFVMPEFFPNLQRLRNNSPPISSFNKRPYFADGPIGYYTKDSNSDGKLVVADGDKAHLYIGMRRGGRAIYALDVSDPHTPKLMWKIDNTQRPSSDGSFTTSDRFRELGQSWSEPKVVEGINGYGCPNNISTAANCTGNPVLIFGAGYDPTVEDFDPSTITASTATTVTTAAGTFTRSMGRAIYVVDALTGKRIVTIGGQYSYGDVDHGESYDQPDKIVAGMDCAIASDVTVLKNLSGGAINRAYVGDTCGNLWRLDFGNTYDSSDATTRASWVTVTKIASVGGTANADRRKFFYPPDIVSGGSTAGYDALLIGSGDREHPFDQTVVNRMYMFKDRGGDLGSTNNGPYTGTTRDDLVYPAAANDFDPDYPTIAGSASAPATSIPGDIPNGTLNNWLYDATNNCLQQACDGTSVATEKVKLDAANGWFVTLASGEKVIGNAVALAGAVFFNTNQPSDAAGGGNCGSNLGLARQYQIAVADATAVANLDTSVAALNIADRSVLHAGGGYLPSPVHVVVQLTDTVTGQTEIKEAVISGTEVMTPGETPLMTRFRKYWYKEIDQ